jgi:hypothetical protein
MRTAEVMRRSAFALAVASLAGCGGSATASWSTGARALAYDVKESRAAVPDRGVAAVDRQFALNLTFTSGGSVTVTEMGVPAPSTMDRSGHLSAGDPAAPPINYELIALSILPPGDGKLAVGDSWSVSRPTDAEAASMKSIVVQEKFDYRVLEISDAAVKVGVTGWLRLAPSQTLTDLVNTRTMLPAAAVMPFIAVSSPYVVGTATFDRGQGSTLSAAGVMVPFSLFQPAGTDVNTLANRLAYTVTRR